MAFVNTASARWNALPSEAKMKQRLDAWYAAESIQFTSPRAEKDYKERVKRITDATQLKRPDRVPISPSFGGFFAGYYGYSELEVMYDADKAADAALRGTLEFPTDGKMGIGALSGSVYDTLDYRLFSWPGHGVDKNAGWQFREAEYMPADEYDALITDPSDYWMRVHLPRIIGTLEPFSKLSSAVSVIEQQHVMPYVARFGLPEVQTAVEKFLKAGREALAWQQKLALVSQKLDRLGFPDFQGGMSYAPFDFLGDTLRGTKGIMLDMYRRPDKLLEALERVTPLMNEWGSGVPMGACPIVFIPLHKGADGFMSEQQFKTFYWPTLLKVIQGLNSHGLIPRLFAEGGYNSRLALIQKDLPEGKTIWQFDLTDMARAKAILGSTACIMGNVPVTLIFTAGPEEVVSYCRQLIDTAGKDGGFIMATGVGVGRGARVENVRAMINTTMDYGVYR